MDADGVARGAGRGGGDAEDSRPASSALLSRTGGSQDEAAALAASSWVPPLSQQPMSGYPPAPAYPYFGSYHGPPTAAPAPPFAFFPQPSHGSSPSTGSTWRASTPEAMTTQATMAAATAPLQGLGSTAAQTSLPGSPWLSGTTSSPAPMAIGPQSTTNAHCVGQTTGPPQVRPPAFPGVGASGAGTTAPATQLRSPSASVALPTSTPRPVRDSNNPFFSQMDDLVARLSPGERPRMRAAPTGAASSRRPPPTPADAAAAVAAANAVRSRAAARRRQAENRRAAAQIAPLTDTRRAAAALAGQPETTAAPAVALASGLSTVTAGIASAATTRGDCSCAPLLVQLIGVFNGFLQSHVQERQATAADSLSMRKGMAVLLSNSGDTKDDVARIHELANATSLSVERVATSSSALAYNTTRPAGPAPEPQDGLHSSAGTPGLSSMPSASNPTEAPWAIPLQKKLIERHQDIVIDGVGVDTAFLTTEKIDGLILSLLQEEFNESSSQAKLRMEAPILTKSLIDKSGFAPVKTRVFIKRVLPRWQDTFTTVLMEGFNEKACELLKTGKKSGEGTRGDFLELQSADALFCLKDNWWFMSANGREAMLFGAKRAFKKLGCLSSVYVEATTEEAAYFKMRTGLLGRVVSTTYHGLRKIAGYCSLSDTGGNTDVVTRKVWAAFVSMLEPPVRARDKCVVEGLMLTDGDDPDRAVVEDIPLMRQATARVDIAETKTGELPSARSLPRKPARRRSSGTPAPTLAADTHCGSRKRKGGSENGRRPTGRTRRRVATTSSGGSTELGAGRAAGIGVAAAAAAAPAVTAAEKPAGEEDDVEEEEDASDDPEHQDRLW